MYEPSCWIILKIQGTEGEFYRVLAGWSGGYLDGSSWRLNSGITKVDDNEDHYIFHGHTGSKYKCYKGNEQVRMSISDTLANIEDKLGDRLELVLAKDIKL